MYFQCLTKQTVLFNTIIMKKTIALFAILCTLALSSAAAQTQPVAAEISFTYASQRGSGSNQFAVWVEDAQGNYVKTIYATRFTANGGWERRPLSLLQWVKQSALSKMSRNQIDVFTGPTPKSGKLTYRWDGTNQSGVAVAAGEYRLLLEATLRNENRVVYSAAIPFSGSVADVLRNAEVTTEYSGSSTAERAMIRDVQVRIGE
jgi:hypothetical protein